MAQQASAHIAVRDSRQQEATAALLHREHTARARSNERRMRGIAIQNLRRDCEQEDAKVGTKVFVGAVKAEDGTLSAGRLNVGKDGLTPPM